MESTNEVEPKYIAGGRAWRFPLPGELAERVGRVIDAENEVMDAIEAEREVSGAETRDEFLAECCAARERIDAARATATAAHGVDPALYLAAEAWEQFCGDEGLDGDQPIVVEQGEGGQGEGGRGAVYVVYAEQGAPAEP
jgi:hypothetical protein